MDLHLFVKENTKYFKNEFRRKYVTYITWLALIFIEI